jgi:diguanylate cyclase (GGDEF)-like protein
MRFSWLFARMAFETAGVGDDATSVAAPSAHERLLASARVRFVFGSVAVAVLVAVGTTILARWLPVATATFVVAFVVLVALAARLGRRFEALERTTREDPMTRVGNRRHWETCLRREVDRALGSRMPLSVLMVDLDNLKRLNDAHGHGCGDRALALVGEVLRDTCRSRDVAARYGGDEFTVLLPRTRVSEARVVAERIRSELARRRAVVGARLDPLVTVSIGIADLDGVPNAARSSYAATADLLFESADRALYVAKSRGRDRIEAVEVPCISGVIRLDEHRAARKGRINSA